MTQTTALIATLAIEIPVVVAVLMWWRPAGLPRWGIVVAVALAASLITHPVAWEINRALAETVGFGLRASVIETGVIIAEMLVYRLGLGSRWSTSLLVSTIANLTSFGIGLVLVARVV